jgi:chitinase
MSRRLSLVVVGLLSICALVLLVPADASAQTCSPAWAPNVSYAINAPVSYGGRNYTCRQAHTSLVGWEPPNVGALWLDAGACGGGTPTPTSPTATPTNTPRTTATPTNTPRTTATPTNTPRTTATPTNTPRATATPTNPTATPTTGTGTTRNYQAAYWTQNNDPCTNNGPAGSGEEWTPLATCSGTGCAPAWNSSTAYNGGAQVSRTCGGNPTATPTSSTPTPTVTPTGPTPTPTTPPPTPTPCSNCNNLPAKVITGYWQNFNNGARCLRVTDVPTKYNLIAIAFADATTTPGGITFNVDSGLSACISGGYTNAQFTADVATVKARGQRVIISVGGETGRVSVNDSGAANTFASNVISLMNTFGFQGVDIDLENGLNPTYMIQALRSIRSQRSDAIIAMAPQTIDMQSAQAGYFATALDAQARVDIVNTQFYNSGCMLGCDGMCVSQGGIDFLTMQTCLHIQNGLPANRLGLGVPASPSGAGSGYISPSLVNQAMTCLASGSGCAKVPPTRGAVRGAMTWSISWDAVQNYSWVNTINVP